jgi:NAD-dependent SIR2 family protein deacetylase
MSKTTNMNNLESAARLIQDADMMVFVTGAGMGIDSGLPDFRGTTGFWQAYPALGRHNINFTSIASPQAYLDHPRIAWGFYGHRLALYRRTTPHEGFNILKRWGENSLCGFHVFTSNVDGHFQKAGFDEASITECHGSINHLQCLNGFAPVLPDTESPLG